VHRRDDYEEKVKVRLKAYHANIGKVAAEYYRVLTAVSGDTPNETFLQACAALARSKL